VIVKDCKEWLRRRRSIQKVIEGREERIREKWRATSRSITGCIEAYDKIRVCAWMLTKAEIVLDYIPEKKNSGGGATDSHGLEQ